MTTLTMRDEKRLEIIHRVFRSELTVGQAALVMGISERQCYRVKARVNKSGAQEWFMATGDGRANEGSRSRPSSGSWNWPRGSTKISTIIT